VASDNHSGKSGHVTRSVLGGWLTPRSMVSSPKTTLSGVRSTTRRQHLRVVTSSPMYSAEVLMATASLLHAPVKSSQALTCLKDVDHPRHRT
jgi:hypothetical protein